MSIAVGSTELKVVRRGKVSVPTADGATSIVATFNHNLGYIPVCEVFQHQTTGGELWDKLPFPILDIIIDNTAIAVMFNVEVTTTDVTVRSTILDGAEFVDDLWEYEFYLYDAKY